MPRFDFVVSIPVIRTPRVMQLEGLFEVAPSTRSLKSYSVNLPLENKPWNIGLIVGPSGSGKSTVARNLFPESLVNGYTWDNDKSVVDGFPADLGIKEIAALLSSVGFSSPPAWLRPYSALSNGEQFRVTLARALAENKDTPFVVDEFTSVVDRTVAQIGSAAVAKAVRARGQQFIAVTCHYDVIDWLQPDWIYEPHVNEFRWRLLCPRPRFDLTIRRVDKAAWQLFKHHHYLDTNLHGSSACFLATIGENTPVAFTAVLSFPHATRPGWREHRTVCLPDYQGVGIGNAVSEFVASLFVATGKPYTSSTSNPAMIRHRAKSQLWKMTSKPKLGQKAGKTSTTATGKTVASNRAIASFEYVGPARAAEARAFGLAVLASRRS